LCNYSALLIAASTTQDEMSFSAACAQAHNQCLQELASDTICGAQVNSDGPCDASLADVERCFESK